MKDVKKTTKKKTVDRDVLTLAQAAELLQVKTETLRYWAIDGRVPGRKIGKFWRFSRIRLVRWCEGAKT